MTDVSYFRKWAAFALFNFVVLAAAGVVLRYKILFPLPLIDQKHLLHGHSHFAFAGWVSLALYIAIIYLIQPSVKVLQQAEWLLVAQQMSSYGMLFTFPLTGYAAGSIAFSTASILISYAFAGLMMRELLKQKHYTIEKRWIVAGLVCNVVSSLGTFVLAYLMMTKNLRQDWYFGSVYFFLHFQYNGFFLFTIGAMFFHHLSNKLNVQYIIYVHRLFNLLLLALVPAWFLSLMWMRIPQWMYLSGVAGALIQLAALWFFLKVLLAQKKIAGTQMTTTVRWFWIAAGCAFSLKIILQACSAVPQLNVYAFGLRPVIIGFLHLVLLAFVSVFIMGYFFQNQLLYVAKKAAWVFLMAVLFNEIVLMLQGAAAISYQTIPFANYLLLGTALLLFLSLLLLLLAQLKNKQLIN